MSFATNLAAMRMIARALEAGVAAGWVTGDEVYGQHAKLRMMLEERRMPYVLAVAVNQRVIATVDGRIAQLRADSWRRCCPGRPGRNSPPGTAPGPRVYLGGRARSSLQLVLDPLGAAAGSACVRTIAEADHRVLPLVPAGGLGARALRAW